MAITPTVETAHDEETPHVPILGYAASCALHVVFVMGTLSTLWSSHFDSWNTLSQEPEAGLARFIEQGEQVFTIVMLVGAVLLGITSARRLARGQIKPVVTRFVVIAFLPIVIELTAFGVQDGSPKDLDLVAPQSVVLLLVLVLGPFLALGLDVRRLRVNSPSV